MTDSTDNLVIVANIEDLGFQDRCRLRFINAAIAVMTEEVVLTATAITASGNGTLHFASVPASVVAGMNAFDITGGNSVIPDGVLTVGSVSSPTVTLSGNVAGAGVAIGDSIAFAPAGMTHATHVKRNAFAGALIANNVDLRMLTMMVLANATCRTKLLADTADRGGNILDSDIDFQVNSVFTGIALARSW